MTNPNHYNGQANITPEEKSAFTLGKVEEWRSSQYAALSEIRAAHNFSHPAYQEEFHAKTDESLDKFLADTGVTSESPNYSEIRALYREASIDNVSEDEWNNSPASRGESDDLKSKSDEFKDRINHRLDGGLDKSGDSGEEVYDIAALQTEAILENAHFDVATARDEWSTITAKRQGKAFGSTKNHDQVRDKYHERVQALGILELEEQVNATDDDNEKNLKVIEYLFEEQRKLRDQTIDKLNNTTVGRFVKFMNKGSFGMRLLKGAGVGVVVGGVGAMAFGAVGAAAGATAAIAASRFVKGYAQGDRHRGMKTAQEEFVDSDDPVRLENSENYTLEERVTYAADVYNEAFEDDTQKEQNKRKKALAWGIGSVAVGAGIGYALTNLDSIQGVKNDISDWVNGKSIDVEDTTGTDTTENHTDNTTDLSDRDRDGYDNDTDVAPGDSTIGAVDFSEITREARWIEHGEGGYQTLQELGVPEEKWDAVWADAGEHFADEGKAYMMEDGHYGWADPGRLTDADITELAKAARRQGVILDATFVA